MKIKAIIFDFYGVIRSDEYWNLVKRDRNLTSDFSQLADEVNLGKLGWQDFLNSLSKEIGKPVAEISHALESENINLPLLSYIAELHKQYKTGLLSNAAYEFFEPQAKAMGLTKLFNVTLVSSRIGFVKPDPKIYQLMLEKLKTEPAETIYIDDVSRYCDGAKALGMQAIWYQDFAQMKRELEQILAG